MAPWGQAVALAGGAGLGGGHGCLVVGSSKGCVRHDWVLDCAGSYQRLQRAFKYQQGNVADEQNADEAEFELGENGPEEDEQDHERNSSSSSGDAAADDDGPFLEDADLPEDCSNEISQSQPLHASSASSLSLSLSD
jgi:hypothetical protein